MGNPVFSESIAPEVTGWGAFIQAVSNFDEAQSIATISAQVQVFSQDGEEEHAEFTLKFSSISGFDVPDLDIVVRGTKYVACVAASVGAAVWTEVSECKEQISTDNPDASWPEIWRATVNCAKTKNPKAKKALQGAMIACSPSFL